MPAVAEVQFKATNTQTIVTAFNSVGTAAQQASTKIGQFTAAATTKVQQFTSSLNSIKSQGDPFSNLTNNLNSFNKSVDQSSKTATTFGQKLKNFGSQFGSSIATIGTLSGTILSLSRQYQDLSDSQIRVDRSQLKVSKTTEAVGVAQGKLNALVAKGVTSGAEYDAALLNVKQALEAQDIAQRNLTEAQEDHQRAQENFWIGLVPTVTSAGASIISVLNDIGGTKGLGGLKTALGGLKPAFDGLKTAFTGLTGIGGIATGLTGIGNAANGSVTGLNGMTTATTGLGTAMKGLALSAAPVAIAIGGIALIVKSSGMVIHEITSIMKGDILEAVNSISQLIDFYDKLGSVLPLGAGFKALGAFRGEAEKLKKSLEGVPQTVHAIDPAFQQLDNVTQGINNTIDSTVAGILQFNKKASEVPAATAPAAAGITGIGTAASTTAPEVESLGISVGAFAGTISTIPPQTVKATTGISNLNAGVKLTTVTTKGYSTELTALIKNATQNVKLQQQLSNVLGKTAQSFNKTAAAANKYNQSLNPNYRVTMKGQPQISGKLAGDIGHYVTSTGSKKTGGGKGPGPQPVRVSQHGYFGTVKRPTVFLAGEGGRPEDVTVRPRGSVQRGGGGGGGFYGTVNVYVDGVLRPARYDMGARK